MGILDFLLKIFGKKAQSAALESASTSLESASKAMQERFNSGKETELSVPTIELEKDSLQLGIAAGYTGRSLRTIESSLVRIESQMITKDWFDLQFGRDMKELINILKQHEDREQTRFEIIQNSLNSIRGVAKSLPQPIKLKLYEQVQAIESQLPPTPRMKEIINILEEYGEMSYEDLSKKLNISISSLRGLLANMMRRTNKIQRFEKDGKGWVRIINSIDLNRSQSAEKAGETKEEFTS